MSTYLKIQENFTDSLNPIYRLIEVGKNDSIKYSCDDITIPFLHAYLICLNENDEDTYNLFYRRVWENKTVSSFNSSGETLYKCSSSDECLVVKNDDYEIRDMERTEYENLYNTWRKNFLETHPNLDFYRAKIREYFKIPNNASIVYIGNQSYGRYNNPAFVEFVNYRVVIDNMEEKDRWNIFSKFPYFVPFDSSNVDSTDDNKNIYISASCVSVNNTYYIYFGKAYLLNENGQTLQKL